MKHGPELGNLSFCDAFAGTVVKEGCRSDEAYMWRQACMSNQTSNTRSKMSFKISLPRMSSSGRGPGPRIRVKIEGGKIVIEPADQDAVHYLREMASQRGMTLPEVVAEALRLEKRLAEGDLLIREGDSIKEIVAV
jgi:hypothetical protein